MNTEIDITADLVDGSDGALGDSVAPNAFGGVQQTPEGAQPVNADAPTAAAPSVDPEANLREMLTSAFKGTDGAPTTQQNAATAQPATAITQDADGKWRTPDGTFASAEQVAAFTASQNAPNNAPSEPSPALTGLTPMEQQQFQSLPAELRQYVERTMEGLNTRASRYSEYDLIEQMIGPRREAYAQQGTTPAVALNQLFAISDYASTKPGDFVLWFAQQNGLDLDALLDARDAANQQQQNLDPVTRQLHGQVQQLTGTLHQMQQSQQQTVERANYQAVENFAIEKDANGTPLRPYLTDVMDGWASQITALRVANPQMPNAELLEKAYQNACWADPAVRAKMQKATNENARLADATRTAAAKAAGSSINGAPAGTPSTNSSSANLSLREEIEQNFAAASA